MNQLVFIILAAWLSQTSMGQMLLLPRQDSDSFDQVLSSKPVGAQQLPKKPIYRLSYQQYKLNYKTAKIGQVGGVGGLARVSGIALDGNYEVSQGSGNQINTFFDNQNVIQDNQKVIFGSSKNIEGSPSPLFQNSQNSQIDKNVQQKDSQNSRSQQQVYRQAIFNKNLIEINANNQDQNRKYNMGVNQYTDMTQQQFEKVYTKLIPPSPPPEIEPIYSIPDEVLIDWRHKVKSPVVDQGICGCCYAIAALDAIHLSITIFRNFNYSFSVQEAISCGEDIVNIVGCEGGYFDGIYEYAQYRGIGSAQLYPMSNQAITQGVNPPCNVTLHNQQAYLRTKFFLTGSAKINYGDCKRLVEILKMQAISVAIASGGFRYYDGDGTFTPKPEHIKKVNHGVLLVGYHPKHGYLVKNSWGIQWGDKGYGYVSQEASVCNYAMHPLV